MKKKILTLVLCSIITISSIVFPSRAFNSYSYNIQEWTLIDSGGHLDWDGSSKYMTEWYDAVNTWNYYKHGVIRVDRWDIIEDVHIYDKAKKTEASLPKHFQQEKYIFTRILWII